MATKRRKVRKSRKRSCKNGSLKRPIRTKSGRKRRCKKRKSKKRKTKKKSRKYKMKSLKEMSLNKVLQNINGTYEEKLAYIKSLPNPIRETVLRKFLINSLMDRVEDGDIQKVQLILNEYPSIIDEKEDWSGNTPLLSATEFDDENMVKLLLDNGADPNINNTKSDGGSALSFAMENNNMKIIDMLLEAGADSTEYDKAMLFRKKEEKARDILEELNFNNWNVYLWFRESDILSNYLYDNDVDVNYLDNLDIQQLYENRN